MTTLWISEPSVERSFIFNQALYHPFSFATPLHKLLQHLSALFIGPNEKYLCLSCPYNEDEYLSTLVNLSIINKGDPPPWIASFKKEDHKKIKFWGLTPGISEFIKQNYPSQKLASLDIIKKWCSKETLLKKERLALTFKNEQALIQWIMINKEGVLKAPYGSAGSSLFFYNQETSTKKLISWIKHSLHSQGVILVEPLLKIDFCFSSLWDIPKVGDAKFLSFTEQLVTAKGGYLGTKIYKSTPQKMAPYLEEHLKKASLILQEIQKEGYSGPICFDAFTYHENGEIKLRPIGEINIRYTMGNIALKLSKRNSHKEYIELCYHKGACAQSILPLSLKEDNGSLLDAPLSLRFKCV